MYVLLSRCIQKAIYKYLTLTIYKYLTLTVTLAVQVQRDKMAQKRRVGDLEKTLDDAQNSVRMESERRGEAEGNYLLIKNEMQCQYLVLQFLLQLYFIVLPSYTTRVLRTLEIKVCLIFNNLLSNCISQLELHCFFNQFQDLVTKSFYGFLSI